MRSSIPGILTLIAVISCAPLRVRAADPQSYRVDIATTGDRSMDDTLRATSELVALQGTAPVSPFGLIARARGETDRLKTVLESYGYYESLVTIKVEGMPLNGVGLADALNALPKGTDAKIVIDFGLGPLYHLRDVKLDGTIPPEAQGAFVLRSGSPAVAADVLAAGSRLLTALQEGGYAFAKVDPPVAYEDKTQPLLDVSFRVAAGDRVKIGEIHLEGLQRVHEKLIRRRLTMHSGEQYRPSAIEAARRDLLTLGPIAAITIQVGTAPDSTGGVPITFVFRERRRHAVTLTAAYSSDLGGSGGVTWSDRNVFGNAEQLTIATQVLNLGGSAITGIGYDTSAKLTLPDVWHRDQSLQLAIGAINQSLVAYDQKAVTSSATLTRKLSTVWTASAGLSTADEQISQEGVNYNYTLVAIPVTLSYDSTHLASPLDDPLHGMRNSFSVAPTRSLGHPSASFIISQVKLAAYFDLHELHLTDPGRSVLAARLLGGIAQGAGEFSLPPDQRFYAGGSGTIRGYRYQAVGPQFVLTTAFPNSTPAGGTRIAAGSLELRQRFGAALGGAVFVDGGQVRSNGAQLNQNLTLDNQFRIGVGMGVRYYTAIGPIRLDLAVPTRTYGVDEDRFEIYIGLGQAF